MTNWPVTNISCCSWCTQSARIGNRTGISKQYRATNVASKSATPFRFLSLLPCPADHCSSTLKSVHWNCSEPIVMPEQPVPLRQISRSAGPIKLPSDTVVLSQGADPLCQAIRWMNRTYIYKQTYVHIMHVGSY